MRGRQNKQEIKYVLREIANYPSKQIPKQSDVKAFLQNKVDRLQIENRVLAQQLSQQIRNRQVLTLSLAEERQKYEQAMQTISKMGKTDRQQLTKMPSHQRLKYLKQSNSNRKQSVSLENEGEYRKFMERVQILQTQMLLLKSKSEKDEELIKQLKQQLLFSKEHLKRAYQEKNELEEEMEQGRIQMFQANQLLARQNAQILNMKFQLERRKQSDSGHRIELASFYLEDLEDLQKQISRILCQNVEDHELRQQLSRHTNEAIKQVEGGWLNATNKQQY